MFRWYKGHAKRKGCVPINNAVGYTKYHNNLFRGKVKECVAHELCSCTFFRCCLRGMFLGERDVQKMGVFRSASSSCFESLVGDVVFSL